MSAKWRALQHRHRYTYSSVVFPASFLRALTSLESAAPPSSRLVSRFLSELRIVASLDTTYAQVAAAKDLSNSFAELLAGGDGGAAGDLVPAAAALYLEMLFVENSLPLHRTLISALARSRKALPMVESCLVSLCREHGRLGREGRKPFLVSRALLSLISYPKLGFLNGVLGRCAAMAGLDVSVGVAGVAEDIGLGSRPSPAVMEQCQDAMSCLYYLLQSSHPEEEDDDEEEEGSTGFALILEAIVRVLKSSSFSRDCLVAAGVSFCAALQTRLSSDQLASFIAWGFFRIDGGRWQSFDAKMPMGGVDLFKEISEFPVLGRICLLRGMLTAVPRAVLNTRFGGSNGLILWTILYDGILPELCNYCENPVDSHFNFHQIRTSLSADLTDFSQDYDPLPGSITARLLRIIWNNLEDPLNQTVKQVHLIFDLLLDIELLVPAGEGAQGRNQFLYKIASDLLRLGPRCKGRYAPLASLTRRLSLVFDSINAYMDDDVCCAITSFLKCFFECLRDECWSSHGVDQGYAEFRALSLPPVMQGLLHGTSKLRSNLNTYALPVVLEIDVDSIFPMLASISVGPNQEESETRKMDATSGQSDAILESTQFMNVVGGHADDELGRKQCMDVASGQRVAALVSLLKVSRQLALVGGDIDWDGGSSAHAALCVKGVRVKVPVVWFVHALTHVDENVRVDAAESLFLNPKTASLPSLLELKLMREVVPLNMRCCSTGFQMRWTSLFRKFFLRVRTALERQVKQGSWLPNEGSVSNGDACADHGRCEDIQRARNLLSFMKWLSAFLFSSCYCSAPYERKTMAMGLLLTMLDAWPAVPPPQGGATLYPYSEGFTSPELTLSLVGSIVDSWDRLRESSFRILLHFPSPLPGMASCESVKGVIRWAKKLVCSPRVRESDAGALTLRLIFRKYVLELGWVVWVSDDVICHSSQSEMTNGSSKIEMIKNRASLVQYISSLIDWLRIVVELGERDLSEACRNCFVHGVLLALRYTFEEFDWSLIVNSSSSSDMKSALEELLGLVMRITSLALWVVSADAWYLPDETDDMDNEEAFISDMSVERDHDPSLHSEGSLKLAENAQAADQAVMVGCWLAMKEVSLLLGTIIRKIPLPSCDNMPDSRKPPHRIGDPRVMVAADTMLDVEQLEAIGSHFLQVLLKMKHNGAIDKTRAGFTALCNRLLCSNVPRLCRMTEFWMDQLMERIIAKGQSVDDLLRRSAGIPAAFMALFLSEPEGAPKKLLPCALGWLIDVAKKSLCNEACNPKNMMLGDEFPEGSNNVSSQSLSMESDLTTNIPKTRDEGVIPTVHAFNVLRAAFNDTNLSADTSGFCAEALIIAIRSFSSPYWEVRNSACLAYTALVRRMIGFLNVQKRDSARRALTGLEFFHRYPALHSFLFDELKIATRFPGSSFSGRPVSNVANAIHPSLCPILILLSRLKPLSRCATQSNLRVRVLASRALTGLVSNEKLPTVLKGVAQCLPSGGSEVARKEAGLRVSGSLNESEDDKPAAVPLCVSFNSVHGILMQLNSLVDGNCRNLKEDSKKDLIISDLTCDLWKCSWMGSFRSCPCPTLISSYLRVLGNMFDIAIVSKGSSALIRIKTLLLELSSECLDGEKSGGLAFFDPTVVEVRKQAAASFFGCFFAGNLEAAEEHLSSPKPAIEGRSSRESPLGLQEKMRFCISDPCCEVRLVTLKLLLKFVKSAGACTRLNTATHGWLRTGLQPMLMELLATEENPRCIYYILSNIFSWNLLHFVGGSNPTNHGDLMHIGAMGRDSVLSFWERLGALIASTSSSKARVILICCMGLCIRRFRLLTDSDSEKSSSGSARPGIWGRWDSISGCIDKFLLLVKKHSSPAEPVNLRKAAADGIVASGLLEEAILVGAYTKRNQTPAEDLPICEIDGESGSLSLLRPSDRFHLYGTRVLEAWFTCIQLLEDEDICLRQRLAEDVQGCIGSYTSRQSPLLQVERVIELSFDLLSSIFGNWVLYLDHLLTWVFRSGDYEAAQSGNLVRQVFDKEIDNHHEEKLLICQICCSHCEKLLKSPSWAAAAAAAAGCSESPLGRKLSEFLGAWRSRFIHRLVSFSDEYLEGQQGRGGWVGGSMGAFLGSMLSCSLQWRSRNLNCFRILMNKNLDFEPHFPLKQYNLRVFGAKLGDV
ncbi:unnamed protein product [Spirodela intermedia]|uniref:Uncharacterized protein n=1 Tax=Spirodela intermedia TaxID=51605 RepID=A0A7I8J6V4_SPIIN|nr:unnamed protein product [Spirodela intermedia]CAA6665162.1 unnamed protein product [Spirodela intermedia]